MSMQPRPEANPPDAISFAEAGDGVVVIRVRGRGSFANSADLKRPRHRARAEVPE